MRVTPRRVYKKGAMISGWQSPRPKYVVFAYRNHSCTFNKIKLAAS